MICPLTGVVCELVASQQGLGLIPRRDEEEGRPPGALPANHQAHPSTVEVGEEFVEILLVVQEALVLLVGHQEVHDDGVIDIKDLLHRHHGQAVQQIDEILEGGTLIEEGLQVLLLDVP